MNEKNKTWEEHTNDLVSNAQKNKGNKNARALLAVLVASYLNTSDLPPAEAQKRSSVLIDLIDITSIRVANKTVFESHTEALEAFLYRQGYAKCLTTNSYFWRKLDLGTY